MTTDRVVPQIASGPRIILTEVTAEAHPDADAQIHTFDPEMDDVGDAPGVIWRLTSGTPAPPPGTATCVAEGLAHATELAVGRQAVTIVPRAEVYRVAQRFSFTPGAVASGFTTYKLDPASASAYEVLDDGRRVGLRDWLMQAATLGFKEVWLHSPAAEVAAQGFARAMLAKAHRLAPGMGFWLSGGGTAAENFEAVATEPGLVALVVRAEIAAGFAPGEIFAALSRTAPEAVGQVGIDTA